MRQPQDPNFGYWMVGTKDFGCPILRALCEGWDDQISPLNLARKTELFRGRPGFLLELLLSQPLVDDVFDAGDDFLERALRLARSHPSAHFPG